MIRKQVISTFIKSKFFSRALKLSILIVLLIFLTHPGRFTRVYDHIPDEKIADYLVPVREPDSGSCPLLSTTTIKVRPKNQNTQYAYLGNIT